MNFKSSPVLNSFFRVECLGGLSGSPRTLLAVVVLCLNTQGSAQNVVFDVDGNEYPTRVIGSQEWMVEDLRTTKYSNGEPVLNAQAPDSWFAAAASQLGAYCILNGDTAYANERGKIYNGYVLYEDRNICPSGWRVPTDSDFVALESFIGLPIEELYLNGVRGDAEQVGVKLKSVGVLQLGTGMWDLSSTAAGTDFFGWNGYPHGGRLAGGDFCCENASVGYLCKDSLNTGVLRRELSFNVDGIIRFSEPLANGHQIRCIKESCLSTVVDTVVVFDTVYVSVTDTLIINTNLGSAEQPLLENTIKIFPNPASTHITIDYGYYESILGYQIVIENSLGQQVFGTSVNGQSSFIDLSTWTGSGLYFVHFLNAQGNTLDVRKILIQ